MITIRTTKGIEQARAEAAKQLVAPRISTIFFVTGTHERDYVFRSGGAR